MTRPWLGIVADDFTGACDVADAVSEHGASAVVTVGVPSESLAPECDCAVVALKTRTAPRETAVAESLAAARWLIDSGCTVIYQKYCSTFDSTDDGNIGPVADALARLLGGAPSVGTPATPRAGRTVYQGHLFVGRQLLSESPMRDHPLTPMRDSDLVALLARQTPGRVSLVAPADLATAGADHILLDALTEHDLDAAARAILQHGFSLVAGAAGLAAALARTRLAPRFARQVPGSSRVIAEVPPGRRLILSGSCSAATRAQVAAFAGPTVGLSPLDLDSDWDATLGGILSTLDKAGDEPLLVTSSADPDRVADLRARLGGERASGLLEAATAEIAARAVAEAGVRRILVAGGETSGAVVQRLGLGTLRVGPAAGPGLPWMVPASGPRLALLLKSGNFGAPDLFTRAWDTCP